MDKLQIRTGFWLVLSLIILVLPLPWVCALMLSSTVHECAHFAALRFMGVSVRGVILRSGGAVLETRELTPIQGLISTLAGPCGAILLVFFFRSIPRTALCALIQSAYHLLPVVPLDGGRALDHLVSYFGWDRRICAVTEWLCLLTLVLVGMRLSFLGVGIPVSLFCVLILARVLYEKYLANRFGNEYNRCTKP